MGIVEGLHPIERNLLPLLLKYSSVDDIVSKEKVPQAEVLRALKWLSDKKLAVVRERETEVVELGSNGEIYRKDALPETRFLMAISSGKKALPELMRDAPLSREEVNICIGLLRRNNLVSVFKDHDLSFEITQDGKRQLASGFPGEALLKKLLS